jgi:hypothetical protein
MCADGVPRGSRAFGRLHAYLRCLNANENVSTDDENNSGQSSAETFLFLSRAQADGVWALDRRSGDRGYG